MTKRSTVIDVARIAGVGASTVSRHLRGVRVGAALAARIEQAIAQLSYQPDVTARALRGGLTHTLGVIIPQVANVFYAQAVQQIEELARERGFAVILLTHQERREQQAVQLATIRRYRTDGLILAPAAGSTAEEIRSLLDGMPVVAIDRVVAKDMDCVVLRNREAGCAATEHLLQHGYHRVACVVSRPEIDSFARRWKGYKQAMAARDLAARRIHAPTHEQLRALVGRALTSRDAPDALLCFSNRVTQTVLQACDALGWPAARRLPMLGFDDFPFAPLVDPPLSVVRQPAEGMMRAAMTLLFSRMEGAPAEARRIRFPAEFLFRRSCGCGAWPHPQHSL